MARAIIRHDDLAGQRAWLDAIRAETYTGMPRRLPRITRPKPPAQAPQPLLFACLPKAKRPPKPTELPGAVARPAEPVPADFTAEELAEIEHYVAGGQKIGRSGDQSTRRWDAWIMEGRAVERKLMQLPGVNARADVEVLETRLGWAANVSYSTTKKSARHVWLLHRPEIDAAGRFFWRTRDAAIAYSANMAWKVGLEHQGHERARRSWAKFADEMKAFLGRCGIDVTVPPPAGMKRLLITAARERELKAGAAPVPAVTTPAPSPAPAAPKPEAAEDRAKPPRVEKSRRRTLAQVVAGAGMLSMREPTQPDRAEIHAAIGEILPPGVPTYVRGILAVNRAPGQKGGRIIADVQMFDGEAGRVEFNGPPGGRSYRWHSIGPEGTTCFWDRQEGRWKRVPKQA